MVLAYHNSEGDIAIANYTGSSIFTAVDQATVAYNTDIGLDFEQHHNPAGLVMLTWQYEVGVRKAGGPAVDVNGTLSWQAPGKFAHNIEFSVLGGETIRYPLLCGLPS